MIVTNGKLYDRCPNCGKMVRLNKPLFGSMHVCLTDEEIAAKRRYQRQILKQQAPLYPIFTKL